MYLLTHHLPTDDGTWVWNDDDTYDPTYFKWADGEPNLNPYPDTNYAQLQQDYEEGEDPIGTWFVPGDQIDNYYFICQSPKVPQTSTTTTMSSTTTNEEMVCMAGYEDMVAGSDKCYILQMDENVNTWDDASGFCDTMMNPNYNVDYNLENTKLASIDSDDENDQLFQQLYTMGIQSAWIGLSYSGEKLYSYKKNKNLN